MPVAGRDIANSGKVVFSAAMRASSPTPSGCGGSAVERRAIVSARSRSGTMFISGVRTGGGRSREGRLADPPMGYLVA